MSGPDAGPPPLQARWALGELASSRALAEGVWRLEPAGGAPLVLKRRSPRSEASKRQLDFEAIVLARLAEAGLPVVRPIADRLGRHSVPWSGHFYQILPYIRHEPLPAPSRARLRWLDQYGQVIARLHRQLARVPSALLPAGVRRNDLAQELLWTGIPALKPHLEAEALARFAPIHGSLEAALACLYAALPQQLIHRDCHAGNFLGRGGEVVGIIDWDQLSLGPPLLDLAYFAVQLAKRQFEAGARPVNWQADWQALVSGYSSKIPLPREELDSLPYLLLTIPLLFATWCVAIEQIAWVPLELDIFFWLHDQFSAALPGLR